MTSLTLETENPIFQNADVSQVYTHTYATEIHQEKKLLLFGNFNKTEQEVLYNSGHFCLPLSFKNAAQNLKAINYKDISCIVIKKDKSKFFNKGIKALKRLKLSDHFPVILYSEEPATLAEVKKLGIVDEVISRLDEKKELDFKIMFLTKIKKMASSRFTLPAKIKLVRHAFSYIIRRAFDITVSLMILILLLPVTLIIALIVKLESRGPVFYISKRAGKHYKIFNCIKFRTMEINADKKLKDLSHLNQYSLSGNAATFVKIKDDPRVTRFGSFLRNSSLDEIPQLINVLLGDMSLVGNRPLPLYEAATLTNDLYSNRFNAPAGITGLWQVLKRGEEDMSTEERIELDIQYANSNSLLVDIWIMIRTPFAMFQKSNV